MYRRRTAAAAVLLASCGLAAGTASPASAFCDAYSGSCPSVQPTAPGEGKPISGTPQAPASGAPEASPTASVPQNITTPPTSPDTLPFTGGELVLMTTLGAGALAGGAVLVVAGRKRAASA